MSLNNFKTYQLAKEFCQDCRKLQLKGELKDQFERASLSVLLNIAEGANLPTIANKRKFFAIALGSLRETQAILDLLSEEELFQKSDSIAALLYRLVYPAPRIREL